MKSWLQTLGSSLLTFAANKDGSAWAIMAVIGLSAVVSAVAQLAPSESADRPYTEAAAADRRLQREAGGGFEVVRLGRYAIAYDGPRERAIELAAELESTAEAVVAFCRRTQLDEKPLPDRFEVVLYDSYERFLKRARQSGVAMVNPGGFFDVSAGRLHVLDVQADPQVVEIERSLRKLGRQAETGTGVSSDQVAAIREALDVLKRQMSDLTAGHEGAHQVLYALGVQHRGDGAPAWLAEGLACLFEPSEARRRPDKLAVNAQRLKDLRQWSEAVNRAREATAPGTFRPPEEVLDLEGLIAAVDLADEKCGAAHAYARAWSLVYYLAHKRPRQLARYLSRIGDRPAAERITAQQRLAEFKSDFGPDAAGLMEDWAVFMESLR